MCVRLYFIEPDETLLAGRRVFDVALQQQPVIQRLDIAAEAQGSLKSLVYTFDDVPADDDHVTVTLTPAADLPPVLSGIEIIEQGTPAQ